MAFLFMVLGRSVDERMVRERLQRFVRLRISGLFSFVAGTGF
jgi:hypothetical protein